MKAPDFSAALSTSLMIFAFDGDSVLYLIGRKKSEPYSGASILPSTYINVNESCEDVARSMLSDIFKTEHFYVEQLNAFPRKYRHPEGRIVNIAHFVLVNWEEISETELPEGYRWVHREEHNEMAFDHNEIVAFAYERLKRRVRHRPMGFYLLPKEFTLKEIRQLYEEVLQRPLDKRNFQKKFTRSELLLPIDKKVIAAPGNKKPSQLYSFDEQQYATMSIKGYDFKF